MKKFCSYLRADLKRLLCSAKIILSVAVTVVVLLLAMLEGPYIGGKMEEAKVYDAELKNLLSEMTGEIKSGNTVTDVILQMQ